MSSLLFWSGFLVSLTRINFHFSSWSSVVIRWWAQVCISLHHDSLPFWERISNFTLQKSVFYQQEQGSLPSEAQTHRVWPQWVGPGTGNRVHHQPQTRHAMNQAQGPSRDPGQEQKGDRTRDRAAMYVTRIHPGDRHTSSIAQTGTEGPGLSLNGAPGLWTGGWRSGRAGQGHCSLISALRAPMPFYSMSVSLIGFWSRSSWLPFGNPSKQENLVRDLSDTLERII